MELGLHPTDVLKSGTRLTTLTTDINQGHHHIFTFPSPPQLIFMAMSANTTDTQTLMCAYTLSHTTKQQNVHTKHIHTNKDTHTHHTHTHTTDCQHPAVILSLSHLLCKLSTLVQSLHFTQSTYTPHTPHTHQKPHTHTPLTANTQL